MFGLFKRKKSRSKDSPGRANHAPEDGVLSSSLAKNVQTMEEIFKDVDTLRSRYIENTHSKELRCRIFYFDGVVNCELINEHIIKPLMISEAKPSGGNVVINQIVQIDESKITDQFCDIVEAITYGNTVLFIEGQDKAVLLNTKNFSTRSVDEPDNEKVLLGPREGFTESMMQNLSLIRRRALTPDLKMKNKILGTRTKTKVCVCYMDSIVNRKALDELNSRLEKIDIDAVLDSNYISELTRDAPWSPFPTVGYTERPDVVLGKLMEGRIAVFVDGSPVVMTLPYLFIENFQSSEDYYMHYYYASIARLLRIVAYLLTISVPALYISIGAFHHEMFPLQLFISIATDRKSVPLPAAIEALVMLIVFDILRETGARMPSTIGSALSIVGALVIGQAAVDAKLVSAPMVIIIALTGITSLLVPKLNTSSMIIRVVLLLFSSMFGFFGYMVGISFFVTHILNLRSFGVPQIMLSRKLKYQNVKDSFMRAPWWQMINRPRFAADAVRQKNKGGSRD